MKATFESVQGKVAVVTGASRAFVRTKAKFARRIKILLCSFACWDAIPIPVIITMRDVGVFLRSTEKALRFFAFSSIVLSEDTLDVSKCN